MNNHKTSIHSDTKMISRRRYTVTIKYKYAVDHETAALDTKWAIVNDTVRKMLYLEVQIK